MVRLISKLLLLALITTARSKPPAGDDLENMVAGAEEEEDEEEEYEEDGPEVSPSFSSSGQNFKVEIGGDITFPCQVENKGTFLLMFKRVLAKGEHRLLFVGDINLKPTSRLSKVGDSFILQGVRRSHAGMYVCRIESSPAIEVTHTLDVQYPATVRRVSPAVQRVTHGASLTLECSADGNPPAAISWSRQQGRLPSGAQAEEGQSITLRRLDRHGGGTYVCTASNGVGRPSSATLTVDVEFPPEVTVEQASLHLREGAKAHLVCIVYGHPSPNVTWSRDGHPLPATPRLSPGPSLGPAQHALIFNPVLEEDFGEYTCAAENALGVGRAAITVSGLPKPPRITSSPAGGEETSYTLTWVAESPAPVTMYRLKYRKTQSGSSPFMVEWKVYLHSAQAPSQPTPASAPPATPVTPVTPTPPGPVYLMSHALHLLQPATHYEATLEVENKYGWSAKSEVFHFFTKREVAVGRSASGCEGRLPTPSFLLLLLLLTTAAATLFGPE